MNMYRHLAVTGVIIGSLLDAAPLHAWLGSLSDFGAGFAASFIGGVAALAALILNAFLDALVAVSGARWMRWRADRAEAKLAAAREASNVGE